MSSNAAVATQVGATGPAGPSPSGSGNTVLASPADGTSGQASLRALVTNDLPVVDKTTNTLFVLNNLGGF